MPRKSQILTELDMLKKTLGAVFDALPSTHEPVLLPRDEAIEIGKILFPHWLLMKVENPNQILHMDTILEMLGRGFLFSAINALPGWLSIVWQYKDDLKNLEDLEARQEILELALDELYDVDDPEKLARQWVYLACGWTPEQVIELDIGSMVLVEVPSLSKPFSDEIESRLASMEDS